MVLRSNDASMTPDDRISKNHNDRLCGPQRRCLAPERHGKDKLLIFMRDKSIERQWCSRWLLNIVLDILRI